VEHQRAQEVLATTLLFVSYPLMWRMEGSVQNVDRVLEDLKESNELNDQEIKEAR